MNQQQNAAIFAGILEASLVEKPQAWNLAKHRQCLKKVLEHGSDRIFTRSCFSRNQSGGFISFKSQGMWDANTLGRCQSGTKGIKWIRIIDKATQHS